MADKRGFGGGGRRNPGIRVYSWFVSDAVIETRSKDAAFPLLCMILFIVPERRRLEQAHVAKHKPSPAAAARDTRAQLVPFGSFPLKPAYPLPFLSLFLLPWEDQEELIFCLFYFIFFFIICNWYRDLGDPKGEKSRKTPKSWVYSFPESRRELLLVVPAELGSA